MLYLKFSRVTISIAPKEAQTNHRFPMANRCSDFSDIAMPTSMDLILLCSKSAFFTFRLSSLLPAWTKLAICPTTSVPGTMATIHNSWTWFFSMLSAITNGNVTLGSDGAAAHESLSGDVTAKTNLSYIPSLLLATITLEVIRVVQFSNLEIWITCTTDPFRESYPVMMSRVALHSVTESPAIDCVTTCGLRAWPLELFLWSDVQENSVR